MTTPKPDPAADPGWFDGHLDLAYLAVNGRDMTAPPTRSGGPHAPAAVTLPSLAAGRVCAALGTIFTQAGSPDPHGYPAGDFAAARAAALAQLETYAAWRRAGLITALQGPNAVAHAGAAPTHAQRSAPIDAQRSTPAHATGPGPTIAVGILMENADPIAGPDDLPWWAARGLRAVGLTWTGTSRYACGNAVPPADDTGLTDAGRDLIAAMADLGIALDISHLADRSLAQAVGVADRLSARLTVVASHSNARALRADPTDQRHLADDTIRWLATRGGVIGLNLYARFLTPRANGPSAAGQRAATVGDAVDHLNHIAAIAGTTDCCALGSDMDGGFSALDLPRPMASPSGLAALDEALADAGWTQDQRRGFRLANWRRVLGLSAAVGAQ